MIVVRSVCRSLLYLWKDEEVPRRDVIKVHSVTELRDKYHVHIKLSFLYDFRDRMVICLGKRLLAWMKYTFHFCWTFTRHPDILLNSTVNMVNG